MRRVEYSFAVTGKSAFYCWTKKVPDENKLLKMMKKHFLEDHLPITLYSASEEDSDFSAADPNLVHNHAYALQTIHDDDTFDIFNPWNSNGADEDVEGKHFEKVNIKFIKNNFDVVVFFGIQEADFDSFERDLTQNVTEDEMYKSIEKVLHVNFDELSLNVLDFEELMTEEDKEKFFSYSNYLFNRNKIRDVRGVDGGFHLAFFEGGKQGICDNANEEIYDYLKAKLPINTSLQMLQRDDDKQCLTLFRLSPHYVLDNFQGLKDEKEK